jgi:hypothetical protein
LGRHSHPAAKKSLLRPPVQAGLQIPPSMVYLGVILRIKQTIAVVPVLVALAVAIVAANPKQSWSRLHTDSTENARRRIVRTNPFGSP